MLPTEVLEVYFGLCFMFGGRTTYLLPFDPNLQKFDSSLQRTFSQKTNSFSKCSQVYAEKRISVNFFIKSSYSSAGHVDNIFS